MKSRLHPSLLFVATVALSLLVAARAEDNVNTIKFSDPNKPGTLRVSLGRGELQVLGGDTKEVAVKSEAKVNNGKPRKDGLREISNATSYSLSEKDNVVTLDALALDSGRGGGDFKVTVPRNTNIVIQNAWGGDFKCTSISGDIELTSMHGEIRLDDVSGGVVVGTMNGEIHANIRELHDGKPLSFTSMNGEVVLRLPETAKANVRLRTQNGSVLTDFDDTALVTKTESAPAMRGRTFSYKGSRGLSGDVQDAIREATEVSAVAVRQALEAVKQGLDSARLDADDARKQLDEAKKQLDQFERDRRDEERKARDAARDAAHEAARAASAAPAPAAPAAKAATAPMPPMPPMKIAMPTISGGKLVTGTLNGGGPEISVATMNGDVVIRKLDKK